MNEFIDPIIDPIEREQLRLMKFAAGELDRDEENKLLLDCEAEPTRWREVALALVEERRLTAVLTPRVAATPAPAKRASRGGGWLAVAACLGVLVGAGTTRLGAQPEVVAEPEPKVIDRYVLIDATPPARPPITPVTAAVLPWFDTEDHEAIKRQGYQLEEEPRFYLVGDGSGRQITIPTKNIKLTPVGL